MWLSASIFHVFGVFLICRSVQTGCVLDFLQEADNPAWSRPLPVPICSYSMKSCTWPFCSNKCAIFINCLWRSFHFISHVHTALFCQSAAPVHVFPALEVLTVKLNINNNNRNKNHKSKLKGKAHGSLRRDALNERGAECMQNTEKAV